MLKSYTFSRLWTPPRTVLNAAISAGSQALLNVEYPVADADLSVEDILVGFPVLRHMSVNEKTLLEQRRDLLDGIG